MATYQVGGWLVSLACPPKAQFPTLLLCPIIQTSAVSLTFPQKDKDTHLTNNREIFLALHEANINIRMKIFVALLSKQYVKVEYKFITVSISMGAF